MSVSIRKAGLQKLESLTKLQRGFQTQRRRPEIYTPPPPLWMSYLTASCPMIDKRSNGACSEEQPYISFSEKHELVNATVHLRIFFYCDAPA